MSGISVAEAPITLADYLRPGLRVLSIGLNVLASNACGVLTRTLV